MQLSDFSIYDRFVLRRVELSGLYSPPVHRCVTHQSRDGCALPPPPDWAPILSVRFRLPLSLTLAWRVGLFAVFDAARARCVRSLFVHLCTRRPSALNRTAALFRPSLPFPSGVRYFPIWSHRPFSSSTSSQTAIFSIGPPYQPSVVTATLASFFS